MKARAKQRRLLPRARQNEIFVAMHRAAVAAAVRRTGGGAPPRDERTGDVSKQILIDAVKKTGMKTGAAQDAVEAIVATISKELKKNQRFSLPGFGSFAVSRRAARMGRNPRTGEAIKIKPSKGVRFKAGAKLKAAL